MPYLQDVLTPHELSADPIYPNGFASLHYEPICKLRSFEGEKLAAEEHKRRNSKWAYPYEAIPKLRRTASAC